MKILVIGAHQDDCEFEAGGLASKLVKKGHTVQFLSMCNGCGGHHIMSPKETSARRAKESAEVAKILGITYDVWDIDDCNIVPDLPTRKRLIRYIRSFNPDVIICNRPNDYHADHRAAGQLVVDSSYLLTVPHECADTPAMRFMPLIVCWEDRFTNPPFNPELVVDIGSEIDVKLKLAHTNESQVYEWLPYTRGEVAPSDEAERLKWIRGMEITSDTTDEEILSYKGSAYGVRFAKVASRNRKELIEIYGEEVGSKIRYAEAFEVCEYGAKLTDETRKLFL